MYEEKRQVANDMYKKWFFNVKKLPPMLYSVWNGSIGGGL